jgi:hypothetical protein
MLPVLVDFYDFQRNTTLIMDCDRYNTKVTLEAQSIKEYFDVHHIVSYQCNDDSIIDCPSGNKKFFRSLYVYRDESLLIQKHDYIF